MAYYSPDFGSPEPLSPAELQQAGHRQCLSLCLDFGRVQRGCMHKDNPMNSFLAGLLNMLTSWVYLTYQHDPCLIWDETEQCLSDRRQGQGSPIP